MTKTLAVSVIMSVYNGEMYLWEAMDSILRQSFRDFEFIIVDDGSTDSTWAILQSYDDQRIVLLCNEENIGSARSLNKGVALARGKYIARIDADDISFSERLEKEFAYLEVHPEVGLLGTACKVLDEDTGIERIRRHPLTDLELRGALVRRNPFVHSSVMVPRHVLEAMGGYNESFNVAIDYELWVRIASRHRLANLPNLLTVKRHHQLEYYVYRISGWYRCKAIMRIRWQAWRLFSRNVAELRFVFLEPIGNWLNNSARRALRFLSS